MEVYEFQPAVLVLEPQLSFVKYWKKFSRNKSTTSWKCVKVKVRWEKWHFIFRGEKWKTL